MTIAQIGTILVRLVNDHEIFPPECGFKKYFDYIHDNNQAVKYVRHLSNLFQLCKVPVTGKRILDAGCGYGLTSLVTRLLGAKEVYGVDLKTDRIMKFGSYLKQLWFNIDGITPVFGDVGRLCFKSESFDAILVNEAISHYGDTEKFLVEARRLLKIGGIIYISDANNACNPLIQWKNRIIWEKFEKGPQGISVYGHQIEKPMEYQRYEIIKRNFPYLSDQQLETRLEQRVDRAPKNRRPPQRTDRLRSPFGTLVIARQ